MFFCVLRVRQQCQHCSPAGCSFVGWLHIWCAPFHSNMGRGKVILPLCRFWSSICAKKGMFHDWFLFLEARLRSSSIGHAVWVASNYRLGSCYQSELGAWLFFGRKHAVFVVVCPMDAAVL